MQHLAEPTATKQKCLYALQQNRQKTNMFFLKSMLALQFMLFVIGVASVFLTSNKPGSNGGMEWVQDHRISRGMSLAVSIEGG